MVDSAANEPGSTDSAQERVTAFLAEPRSYPHSPPSVEVIETHGARVFLAGPTAYKIKRAVSYDYMDFSTLAKRRAALEKEYAINHPHAARIYIGVVAITEEADGRLAIAGDGTPLEWALVMNRFEQDDLLSAIAARGALDTALAEAVADAIADYHADATPVTSPHGAGRIARTLDHLATSGLADPAIAPAERIAAWHARAAAHLETGRVHLDRRAAAGAVRLAHGDLHLANIVVIDGHPELFDAIEFDDEIRTVDRLYDLAFLLMDLDFRACRGPANVILNRYLARDTTDTDLDALGLLPLYLSLRAAIRAMVSAQRANLTTAAPRDEARRDARAYFELAERYLDPAPPRLLAVGGLSGTGKTTLARALAPDLAPSPGAVVVRSDIERKRLFAVPETTRLPPESYTQEASDAVYQRLYDKAARLLAAGHSVILDAVFSRENEREMAARIAAAARLPFTGLWLEAPPETMRSRVAARTGDASDATPAVVDAQLAASPHHIAWARITAAGSPAQTLEAARAALDAAPPLPPAPE